MLYDPNGVEEGVLTVNVLEKFGEPVPWLKRHVAPDGNPLVQDRVTL
jgi:hypothetical protein